MPEESRLLELFDLRSAGQPWRRQLRPVHWLAALRTAAAGRRFIAVVDVAEAMHWYSDRWTHWGHWGHWTEVFGLAAASAEELGDASATATQLNYRCWALSYCDGDSAAAIATAQRAYAVAESVVDVCQQRWARSCEARALV